MLVVSKHVGKNLKLSEFVIGFIDSQLWDDRVLQSGSYVLGRWHDQLCPGCELSSAFWDVNMTQETIWVQEIALNGVQ